MAFTKALLPAPLLFSFAPLAGNFCRGGTAAFLMGGIGGLTAAAAFPGAGFVSLEGACVDIEKLSSIRIDKLTSGIPVKNLSSEQFML